MNENINLGDVNPVHSTISYQYNLMLEEFNGQCRIIYSTNSPLQCNGTINLCTTDGPKIVAHINANATGGHFDTGKNWGKGWYGQWNVVDANNKWTIIAGTSVTV